MHITFGSATKPIHRFENTYRRQKLPDKFVYTCVGLGVGYFATLFLAWNYSFPTQTEQHLWRGACVIQLGTLVALAVAAPLIDY